MTNEGSTQATAVDLVGIGRIRRKRGRPRAEWRIRVVPIDAAAHPRFREDRDHAFTGMTAEARTREIDAYCARVWALAKKESAARVRKAA